DRKALTLLTPACRIVERTRAPEDSMRSLIGILTAMIVLVALPATSVEAQQVRQRDSTPFARCKPLAALASPSSRQTMTKLQLLLTGRGYTIASMDPARGEFLAIKKDTPTSDKSDRVLLWLERDPLKPADRAYIYFLYGRFEPFFGSPDGPVRVR